VIERERELDHHREQSRWSHQGTPTTAQVRAASGGGATSGQEVSEGKNVGLPRSLMTARSEGARPKGIFYCSVLFQRSGGSLEISFVIYLQYISSCSEFFRRSKKWFKIIKLHNYCRYFKFHDHQGCIYLIKI